MRVQSLAAERPVDIWQQPQEGLFILQWKSNALKGPGLTRVKLAHHYDMGSGYIAVTIPNRPANLPYKVSFSVGNSAKLSDYETTTNKKEVSITIEILRARRKAYFEHNANVLRLGDEFVIAMRRH